MKRKLILFLVIFLISIQFVLAQNLPLAEISDENIKYECMGCRTQPLSIDSQFVVYGCSQVSPGCVLTVRNARDNSELAVLKFGQAKLHFGKTTRNLLYIAVDAANVNDNPFDINGVAIPYASSNDRINFAKANTVGTELNPTGRAYFNKFVYEVGSTLSTAIEELNVDGQTIAVGERRPLILCGQTFFDVSSETISVLAPGVGSGRTVDRNSWFNVEKRGQECFVMSYRVSAKPDPVKLRNRNGQYAVKYQCGTNNVGYNVVHAEEGSSFYDYRTVLSNFECNQERFVTKLGCPESGFGKTLCEEETKNVILEAGSTNYFVTGGSIAVRPSEQGSTVVELNGATRINVPVTSDRNVIREVTINPQPGEVVELRFVGKLDESSDIESNLVLRQGAVDLKIGSSQQTRYVLNRPQDTPQEFRYSLIFEDNSLKAIADSTKEESQQAVAGEIRIIGLRIAEDLRALFQYRAGVRTVFAKTINLYPLSAYAAIRSEHFGTYRIVPALGRSLRDIAREELSGEGPALIDNMELIRETSGLHYEDANIALDARGPASSRTSNRLGSWATPNEWGSNTQFDADDIVLVPAESASYVGANGNRVRVVSHPTDSDRVLEENAARRRARRTGTDEPCKQLVGECQEKEDVVEGGSCLIGNDNKRGRYVRGKCLSRLSRTYLCCTEKADLQLPSRIYGARCRRLGGECVGTSLNVVRTDFSNDRNAFCEHARTFAEPQSTARWSYRGLMDCEPAKLDSIGLCCGPRELPPAEDTQRSCSSIGGECVDITGASARYFRNGVILCQEYESAVKGRSGWVSYGQVNCQRTELCCAPFQQEERTISRPSRVRLRGEGTVAYPGRFDAPRLSEIANTLAEARPIYDIYDNKAPLTLLLGISPGKLTCTLEITDPSTNRVSLVSVQNKNRISRLFEYSGRTTDYESEENNFHRLFKNGLRSTCNQLVSGINDALNLGLELDTNTEITARHPMIVNAVS